MKKLIPLAIPIAIAPYLIILVMVMTYTGFLMESVFQNNIFILLICLAIAYVVSFICAVILSITILAARISARNVARTSLTIKLIQVPAYIVLFIIGLGCSFTVFTYAVSIILIMLDNMTIAMTGLIGLSAAIRGRREKKISRKKAVIHGILQFVFCADVVSAFLLNKAIRLSEGDSGIKQQAGIQNMISGSGIST